MQTSKKPQSEKSAARGDRVISHFCDNCTERGERVKALRFAPINAHRTCGLDLPPCLLLCCFQLGKNEKDPARFRVASQRVGSRLGSEQSTVIL